MARATVFNRDPAAQAHAFETQGFRHLHVVDLDGAFAGKPMNAAAVERILETVGLCVQLGGGIRDMATIDGWLGKGVNRVIIGTAAVRDPALVKEAAKKFPSARRGRARCARRQGRGRGLGGDFGAVRARDRAPLRGRRRRGHHLHRRCARRHAARHQLGRHHRAGRRDLDPGDRLRRLASIEDIKAHAGAAREQARRRHRRPRALRRAARRRRRR